MAKKKQKFNLSLKNPFKAKSTFQNLNQWNVGLAILHAVQGIAVLLLSKGVSFPVNVSYLTQDSLASQTAGHAVLAPATKHFFDVNMAYLVAAFFFMSAFAHVIIATKYRKTYESDLKKGINKARWIEYGVSASTMIVAIGLLSGVYDLGSLTMFFGLILIMNLLGLAMEIFNQKAKKVNWLSYKIGCLAGVLPWIVIAWYLKCANIYGSGKIPTFVYFIYGTMFLFFSSFAVNMYLQYKKKGPWVDYLYGERVYMILSLVAKSALAWQIFFGSLRP